MIIFKGVRVIQVPCVLQSGGPASCIHSANLFLLNTGQVITASIADIIANYSFKDILRKLAGEKQTEVAPASYDDSYLGEIHRSSICGFSKDTHVKRRGKFYSSFI